MKIGVISLFPDMFRALDHGITGRAIKQGLLELSLQNPRDFAHDKHATVDDRPYGGGPGMVMMVQPLRDALQTMKQEFEGISKTIYLSPKGRRLDQAALQDLATQQQLILVAGRYEGVDQRFIDEYVDEQWSVGDYVLSGGELAAMVMIDGVTRLIPGALGDDQSAEQDSFTAGLLDHPHYTRPEQIDEVAVPAVLLSGDHEAIRQWRLRQALTLTWQQRPDLLENASLTQEQQQILNDIKLSFEN